jgi:FAD:protein FMN transferase
VPADVATLTRPAEPAVTDARWVELCFRAMGTDVHLAVLGGGLTLLRDARDRIEDLESRWSRFRPDSLVSRLNRADGQPVSVDDETFALLALAVHAWRETGGRFDPTVHDALVAAGYDRSFDQFDPTAPAGRDTHPAPGCWGIRLDPLHDQVTLPEGVRLDLGGIGKGRTADLVASELVKAGAHSVLVNLGGDLRLAGPTLDHPLTVTIEDPAARSRVADVVALRSGALATSSRARRRWTVDGEPRHHLIDPASGRSVQNGLAAVTVLAADAVRAEVLAKAAFVAGPIDGAALLEAAAAPALLIDDRGGRQAVGGFEARRP